MRDKTRTKLTAGLTLSLSKQKQTKNIFCLTPDWRQIYKQKEEARISVNSNADNKLKGFIALKAV